ncbi:MAG TPA: carboxypeptidase regulatory-like domain-containing protein [Terriglobales bacterium]|nr:carboxypeptidase regulatory-like domain-containing protein [Terriglobales bacterium]
MSPQFSSRAVAKPGASGRIPQSPMVYSAALSWSRLRDRRCLPALAFLLLLLYPSPSLRAQLVNVTVQGRVFDTSGAAISDANVTAANTATGLSRTVTATPTGDYQISSLPPGDYTITAEKSGFQKAAKKIHLDIGAIGNVDFNLPVGQLLQEVTVQDVGEVAEPTRTMVSSVIDENKIENLPVNGRQFIDFALLAPAVTVGDTTSGSTDVIIEPVTKLSFAGQNIHYNFVAIDGADNMSTASGIQKTTPSQEGVQEFRVINSAYSTEFGRAVGGIVNIITKSGTNTLHGSAYEYFRNDAMDAKNALAAPGGFNKLRQNQFGGTLGAPIVKDKTFFFANYEGQRHSESPYYNSAVLANITAINNVKQTIFGLPAENLRVNRLINYDNGLMKLDHSFNVKESMYVRYFINDQRGTNLSPLNDGFDLPSGFKNNYFRDQSIVGNLSSVLSSSLVNEARLQYSHRFFDFPTVSTQPHLEVSNVFTMGVNRGNPDFYEEGRWEFVDTVTKTFGKHTIDFGGDFNHVNTTESFPLFYPFEADFGSLSAFLGTDFVSQVLGRVAPDPFVIFFERFDTASGFNEPTLSTSVYQGGAISSAVRNQAKGTLGHTYEGLFVQDKWRATTNLTLNYGLRWQGETWPAAAINNPLHQFDPRAGFSYAFGSQHNIIFRGGAGLFHGTIPSPLLMCQIPSCGGVIGKFPGRENKQDDLNAKTRLSAFGSDPFTMANLLTPATPGAPALLGPNLATATYPANALDAVIVRFAKDHQPPYGAQASLGVEFQPFKDAVVDITGMHVRGVHLGSFYNVNQPDPSGQLPFHDSRGDVGMKNLYCSNFPCTPPVIAPGVRCAFFTGCPVPPGFAGFAVDFEADSKWDSQWDGLLVNFNKRMGNHVGWGVSYTWSKGIDNGPNPSFVLIPQDTCCFNKERAVSSDDVRNRFVLNFILAGPTHLNAVLNDWQLSSIVTLESPHYFTKFAGFDANGDIFGNNDRVGIEPRNTFQGDSYKSVDMRLSRTFVFTEKMRLEAMAEGFNLLNTLNVRFFNTAYGASDFCPAGGATYCGTGPFFREGSPNPSYGTPRSLFNPRQIQLALRLTW